MACVEVKEGAICRVEEVIMDNTIKESISTHFDCGDCSTVGKAQCVH